MKPTILRCLACALTAFWFVPLGAHAQTGTTTNTFKNAGRIANASCRVTVARNGRLIQGFVVTGDLALVLVRGLGPALAQFGLNGLPTPSFVVFDGRGNRVGASVALKELSPAGRAIAVELFARTGAFPLLPGGADAVFADLLAPGAYTLVLTGAPNEEGEVLAEIYQHPQALFVDSYPQIKGG